MKKKHEHFLSLFFCLFFLITSTALGQVGLWPANSQYYHFGAPELGQSNYAKYALLQDKIGGSTFLNTPATLYFRINNTDKMILTNSGNFGIGTTQPLSTLSVKGRVGIRVDAAPTLPTEALRVEGAIYSEENIANFTNLADQDFLIRVSGVGAVSKRTIIGPSVSTRFSLGVGVNNANEHLTIVGGGNVGIGTTTPDSKLTVKGTIHTQEVKVDLNGTIAPDYVFEEDYPLTSLEELKSYIDQNKHLPGVPSAKEMEEEGINLKEMNLLLLKKVEEMTLHLIEMNNKNNYQDEVNNRLQLEINSIKKRLEDGK